MKVKGVVLSRKNEVEVPPLHLVAEIKPPIDFPGIEDDDPDLGNAA